MGRPSKSAGILFIDDSERSWLPTGLALIFGGAIITFVPKARNSVVRRRLASTWRLRRAAVTAAPAPSARRITKRRPRLAPSRRRIIRQNIFRLLRRDAAITHPSESAPARSVKHGAVEGRCQES